MRQSVFVNAPSFVTVTLGGAVATILATALIYLAPAGGWPVVDLPLLVGGLFTSGEVAAFWIGYAIFFLGGWIGAPLALQQVWRRLPGDPVRFRGAVVKGLLFGAGLWVFSGLLVGLLSAVSPFTGAAFADAGLYASGLGGRGILALLAGHLAYGLALAVVAAMGRSLSPIDAIGWSGHGAGHSA